MNDEKTKALEKLIASCGVIIHIGEQGDHPKGCQCDECVDARTCTLGIEAIREMQAEMETRKEPTVVVPREEWDLEDQECARRWAVDVGGVESAWVLCALMDIERLKEELRIAKNSWNFEEGKRIIGERDNLRTQRDSLCRQRKNLQADVQRLKSTKDRAQALLGEMRSERAAAMTERDNLRDKLRTAEGKSERLKAELYKVLTDACPNDG